LFSDLRKTFPDATVTVDQPMLLRENATGGSTAHYKNEGVRKDGLAAIRGSPTGGTVSRTHRTLYTAQSPHNAGLKKTIRRVLAPIGKHQKAVGRRETKGIREWAHAQQKHPEN